MEGIFSMKKWKSILVGLSCLSILLAAGEIPASASDEIPEQSIIYWSMWEEDEPQAEVIREAADAYQEATGISVEIQWKGREIRSLIGPALDAGEEIDLFDDDYQRMVQEHGIYLTDLKKIAASVDYEKHVMPILLEQIERWGKDKLLTMPYQPYITGVWYNKDLWEKAEGADKIIVRPEFVKISKMDEVEKFRTSVSQGVVERVSFRGDNLELQVRVNNSVVTARRSLEKADVREGETVNVFLYRVFALKGDSVQLIENEAVRDDFVII